jgi:TPR repeat protein
VYLADLVRRGVGTAADGALSVAILRRACDLGRADICAALEAAATPGQGEE